MTSIILPSLIYFSISLSYHIHESLKTFIGLEYIIIHQLLKKTQKHANNQRERGSTGSIPSIEITKENIESGDYISDESEYQEGGNGERGQRNNNNGPPSPLPAYAQHQSPQHQYHQPQVRWKQNVLPEHNVLCYIPVLLLQTACVYKLIYLTFNRNHLSLLLTYSSLPIDVILLHYFLSFYIICIYNILSSIVFITVLFNLL